MAAVPWQLRNENKEYDLPVTARTLAGIRREGKDRGRGQVKGLDWQDTERVCAFAESDKTITGLRDSAMIRLMSEKDRSQRCSFRMNWKVKVSQPRYKCLFIVKFVIPWTLW